MIRASDREKQVLMRRSKVTRSINMDKGAVLLDRVVTFWKLGGELATEGPKRCSGIRGVTKGMIQLF